MSTITRIVFQQGIDLRRGDHGNWFAQAASPDVARIEPQAVIEAFDVRPILAFQQIPNHLDIPLLLPNSPGDPLDLQLSDLSQSAFRGGQPWRFLTPYIFRTSLVRFDIIVLHLRSDMETYVHLTIKILCDYRGIK